MHSKTKKEEKRVDVSPVDKAFSVFEVILNELMAIPSKDYSPEKRENDILLFSDSLFLKKYAIHNKLPEFFGFDSPDDSSTDSSDSDSDDDDEEEEEEEKLSEKISKEVLTEAKRLKESIKLMDSEIVESINKSLLKSYSVNPYLADESPSPPSGWIACKYCGFRFCPLSDIFILDDNPDKTKPHVTSANGPIEMLFFVVPHPNAKTNKYALAKLYCKNCATSVASVYDFKVKDNRCGYTGIFFSFPKVVITDKEETIKNIKGWAKTFKCRHERFFPETN